MRTGPAVLQLHRPPDARPGSSPGRWQSQCWKTPVMFRLRARSSGRGTDLDGEQVLRRAPQLVGDLEPWAKK